MAKPTNLGLWATTGTKVEPSTGMKKRGWVPTQKPPAQWLNWWMNVIYLWMVWLDAFESTVHTWTALQTFAAGIAVDSLAVSGNETVGGTLGVTGLTTGTTGHFTSTVTIDDVLTLLNGAEISGGIDLTGSLDLTGSIDFTGSTDPVKTDGITDRAFGLNTAKAWINYSINNTPSPTYNDGCNMIAPTEAVGAGSACQDSFVFADPMANADYAIIITYEGGFSLALGLGTPIPEVMTKSTAGFTIHYNASASTGTGHLNNAALQGTTWGIMVLGRQ